MTDTLDRPLYRKVQDQLVGAILRGSMPAGSRLPSVRGLAKDLGVSRVTVEAAYEALEAQGLIEARARSGTYVTGFLGQPPTHAEAARVPVLPWEARIAPSANAARDRMLNQVFRGVSVEDTIPMAWGAGDPALFPVEPFRLIINRILRRSGGAALGPEETQGHRGLREAFAAYLRKLDIPATADTILVTSGSQQSVDLVVSALVRPGDRVAVEDPTWPGALGALEAAGAAIVGIPVDDHGMRMDALENALAAGDVRLIYTIPTYHNPTGTVMPVSRRRELVRLARRHGVPVLEDDALREVRFGSPLPPALSALDPSGNVLCVGSFSKSLMPAARLGYLVAPPALLRWAVERKRSRDMFCSPLLQRAMAAYLESGEAVRHWKRVSRVYGQRALVMTQALARHFPAGSKWHRPSGSPVLWVRIPEAVSARALFEEAMREGVTFAPGEAFFVNPADQPYIRLNFAALDERKIERGIAKLGALVHAATIRGATT